MGRVNLLQIRQVISRMVDIIMIHTRCMRQSKLFQNIVMCPLLMGLQKLYIPVRFLPTLLPTLNLGNIKNKRVAWIGDGNNMCNSYIEAADLMDFQLLIACPKGFEPSGI